MTELASLQRSFRDALFEARPDGPAVDQLSRLVDGSATLPPAEHVRIYRRAVLGTLTRALESIYPVCVRLVGDRFFGGMARRYVRRHPSRTADLADYGGSLPDFIRGFEPAAALEYLPDVAELEWCWHRAFHAADDTAFDAAALADAAAENPAAIVFRLPASACLLESAYPVHRIWQVNQQDWEGDPTADLAAGGCRLIVWRREYEMRIDELTAAEWRLLRALENGTPLAALADRAGIDGIDTLLPACVGRGWIAGWETCEVTHEDQ